MSDNTLNATANATATANAKWYLGFDCATKTFAFSLGQIQSNIKDAYNDIQKLRQRLEVIIELRRRALVYLQQDTEKALVILSRLEPAIEALEKESRWIQLKDGGVVDLAPGRSDASVSTVERIKALSIYVNDRIRPALAKHGVAKYTVIIEYQMGPNAHARAIAAALVALFATEDVIFVGPSLKNKIRTGSAGLYGNFAKKYSNTYGANKAHAIYNFSVVESAFNSEIPVTTAALRGHIADSFMQVLGHLLYGADEKIAATLF